MTNEISVREENSIVENNQGVPMGLENAQLDSVTVPTAKLLQSNSPEVTDEDFADYGFRAGNIIHSLLLEQMPENFIPIMIIDTNTLFVPRNDGDKQALKYKIKEKFGEELTDEDMASLFICRAKDGRNGDRFGKCAQCRLNKFNGNEKPFCTSNINVLALFEGHEMPVVIRFANTSYKHGNRFKALAMYAGGAIFSRKYKLVPVKKSGNGNNWYEMTVKPAGKPTEEEYAQAKALYDRYRVQDIEVEDNDIPTVDNEDMPF